MKERILFLQAIKIADPGERRAFLEGACHGDRQLLERVESLVAVSGNLGHFLDPDQDKDPSGETRDWENPASAPDLSFLAPAMRTGILGMLAHYEIREIIGQGAFGIVLGGWDTKLEREVAIKVLMPHLAKTSPPRKRFLREARAGAAIRHPNVIQVFAVEEEPIPYIVMERVRGRTLQECIDDEGPLDCSQILPIAVQLTQALAASHATGLIHRDVKPTNILIESGRNPRVVLTDFGLARTVDDASLTQSGFVAGTPMYMSPEQTQGRTLDPRSDQFSLGSVLYLMITGRPPFRASSALGVMQRVTEATPRPISEINPDAPAWLCELIGRMMQRSPEDRFESLDSVTSELQDAHRDWIERGALPEKRQLSSPPTDASKFSSIDLWRLLWLGAAVPLAIVLAVAVWLTQRPDTETPSTADTPVTTEGTAKNEDPISPLEQAKLEFAKRWPSDAPPPAIVPFSRSQASQLQQQWADYMGVPVDYEDPLGIRFRLIPPGIFLMGSSQKEIDRSLTIAADNGNWASRILSEAPQHWVVISHPYYAAATEVTQSMYEDLMATNPAFFRVGGPGAGALKGPDTRQLPVENISWSQAVDLCNRLNHRLQLPTVAADNKSWTSAGWPGSYGLLTEAQWEFACRAGTSTRYWTGDDETELGQNENVNSIVRTTTAVGVYPSNPFGLHDMHGNVYEHVFDLLSLTYYQDQSASVSIDPSGPSASQVGHRVIRGGDWYWPTATSRSASRTDHDPDVVPGFHTGVRLALSVSTVKRLLMTPKTSIAIEATEIHGADLANFRTWIASLQNKYLPISINVRSGSDPILFDAVAVRNTMGVDWQIHEIKDDEGTHFDFQAMKDTHACLWRMYLYADEPPANQPGILMFWVASNPNWQTWWEQSDGMVEEIQKRQSGGMVAEFGQSRSQYSRCPDHAIAHHAAGNRPSSPLRCLARGAAVSGR